jgi:predicted MFS family arabinose efflux permease
MSGVHAEKISLKPLVPLCLAAFAGFLNLFGTTPFFVDISDDLSTRVSLVGYTSTVALLVTAVAGAIVGPISERVGTRRVLIGGIVVAALGAAVTAIAISYGSLVAGRLLAGIGGSITGGLTIGMAAIIYEGRQRQRAIAIITSSMAMAVVIGVFLMTTMAGPYGWRGAFGILSGALLITALMNQVMLDPDKARTGRHAGGGLQMLINVYRPIISNNAVRRLLASCVLPPAVINGATAYIGAFLVTQHESSLGMVGIVFSAIGITYVVGNLLAGNLGNRPAHAVFGVTVILMGFFWMVGYTLPGSPLSVVAIFSLATLAGGISWVVLLGMVAERTPSNVSTAMVLTTSMHSLGGALGIALSAALLDLTGYVGVGIGVFLMAVAAAGIGWVGPERRQTRTEEAPHHGSGALVSQE